MSRHERLIGKTIELAMTSEYRWRHGAILAKGNKIMAASTNKFRNPPSVDADNVSFHAEENVLREYSRILGVSYLHPMNLRGFTLYIARVSRTTMIPTISRPCEACMIRLHYAGIKNFVYTNEMGGYSHEHTV